MYFLAFFALFLMSTPTKVWGIVYEYKCAPTKVEIERTSTSSPYKYTLTITQKTQKTSSSSATIGTENDVEVKIILTTNSQTLEGEYNNNSLKGTKYHYSVGQDASLNTSESSSFKIVRNDDGSYQIQEGTIYTILDGNQHNFKYCYQYKNSSFSKANYTFFPNWDVANNGKYTMSNINTFNAVYNSENNGYDITFKVTGTNSNGNYNYDVSLFLANASDLLGTFRTGTATNTLLPNSTIIWNTTTRYPLEYTSLTISQIAPNQYKLAGKLYALKVPSTKETPPFLYDFGDGVEFTFNAVNYNFSDNGENNPSLEEIADKKLRFNLTLGRILSNEYYNTFCSPIAISEDEVSAIFGAGTDIRTLESSSYDAVQNQLTLTFSGESLTAIEAGKPYLIKPGQEVANPQFTNVATSRLTSTAQTIETTNADFHGILAPYTLDAADPTFLFLAADNQLMWGDEGTLKGMRAYFKVKGISDIQQASMVPARMQFGSKTISTDLDTVSNAQGTIRNGKYMYNGHLVIVHNGKKYNL